MSFIYWPLGVPLRPSSLLTWYFISLPITDGQPVPAANSQTPLTAYPEPRFRGSISALAHSGVVDRLRGHDVACPRLRELQRFLESHGAVVPIGAAHDDGVPHDTVDLRREGGARREFSLVVL